MSDVAAVLGLDPAPGDPDQLRLLARTAGRAALRMHGTADRLRAIGRDDALWQGEAAVAFRARLDALPGDLDDAGAALAEVRHALSGLAERLDDAQRLARRLADDAVEVLTRPAAPPPSYDTRPADLEAVRRRARALHAGVSADAAATAAVLRAAAERAPDEPGWLARAVDAVDAWVGEVVVENARLVEVVSLALSVAAGAAAVTGVGMAVAAPLAAASYAASLALVHYTEADEDDLLLATAGVLTLGVAGAAGSTVRAARLAGASAGTPSAAAAWSTTATVATGVGRAADVTGAVVTGYGGAVTGAGIAGDVRGRRRRRGGRVVLAPGAPTGVVPAVRPAGQPG